MSKPTVEQLCELHWQIAAGRITCENLQNFLATLGGLPTEMTLGGRIYEIPSCLRKGEASVSGKTMLARAKGAKASLGEEDGQWFLDHQDDIPAALRDVWFVFPGWRLPFDATFVAVVFLDGSRWVRKWRCQDNDWLDCVRLPRRKQS